MTQERDDSVPEGAQPVGSLPSAPERAPSGAAVSLVETVTQPVGPQRRRRGRQPWRERRLYAKQRRQRIKNQTSEENKLSLANQSVDVEGRAERVAQTRKHRAAGLESYVDLATRIVQVTSFGLLTTCTAVEGLRGASYGHTIGFGVATAGVGWVGARRKRRIETHSGDGASTD